ncbi:MAG TPA: rhodanese-like domain-containing protein [Anaerolineales bacterium]|nr:rhodanese-like domain-containing protein [Anaerolineales bacterium]
MLNRKTNIFLSIAVLAFVTLACNALLPLPSQTSAPTQIIEPGSTQPQGNIPQTEAEVPRVTVEEAKAAFDSGAAVIVDVRSQEAYDVSHIDGALFVPLGEFESNIANIDLPKEQWIITYCT